MDDHDRDAARNQSPGLEGLNLYRGDRALSAAVRREGGADQEAGLSEWGAWLGSAEAHDLANLAHRHPPRLISHDARGNRIDMVDYHPAYHEWMGRGVADGLACGSFSDAGAGRVRASQAGVARAARLYLAAGSEPGHLCPLTMTNAALAALPALGEGAGAWLRPALSRRYDPLLRPIAEKSGVTFGMGMTEKQGGSDVRANTTRAEPLGTTREPGDRYAITGHKWFLSAPMSDAFLVLAQAAGGLSCFLVPRIREDGGLNGVHLVRLKDKLGNRTNASSEVLFEAAEGYLIGAEGRGIPTIMDMVMLCRHDCVVASAGMMRRAVAEALDHASHRHAFGARLIEQPVMAAVLADLAVESEAATALAFRLARAVDGKAQGHERAYALIMTPAAKYWVCKRAIGAIAEAMEVMGGNGYVEDFPLARLYREAPVNAIWEGASSIQALSLAKLAASAPEALAAVLGELKDLAAGERRLEQAIVKLETALTGGNGQGARDTAELLARTAAACLLRAHAPAAVADAFIASRFQGLERESYGVGLAWADLGAILARANPRD